jgi:ribosome biogenesis GTPase
MRDRERGFDESQVRMRPNPHGSRPRTKRHPEHGGAEPGLVIGVDRGRYSVLIDADTSTEHPITAMKARELGRERVVVGDRVDVVGDTSGVDGSLARIVRIDERTTTLRRSADDTDPVERVLVANAEQLVIVTALADPEPRPRMIDRCVVAAYDAGMEVLLCLTKADLADASGYRAMYEPVGVDVVVTAQRPDGSIDGIDLVRTALEGRSSVLVGHSGVGKSTLVNALVPDAARAIGHVNVVTGRGRHTSSSAVALRMPPLEGHRGGWVIDTPGVRSFGLAHVRVEHLLAAFQDLAEVAESCPRGCTHLEDSPDCELDTWAAGGSAPENADLPARAARLESFRRLLTSRNGGDTDR